jgi:hypothetical protein
MTPAHYYDVVHNTTLIKGLNTSIMTPSLSANATDGNRVARKHNSHATFVYLKALFSARDAAIFAANRLYHDLGSPASH